MRGARLAVKDRAGQVTELFLADTSAMKLACGVLKTPTTGLAVLCGPAG